MPAKNSRRPNPKVKPATETPDKSTKAMATGFPWMELEKPRFRSLKVYALDPSAGNYIGNLMTVNVKWEENLQPGPIGHKIAVIDYDAPNKRYYPPVDLNDPRILARGGLDPTESDPRFHQQMLYAVATETIERFESALGRSIHWRRADRPRTTESKPGKSGHADTWRKTDDIWRLNLFPHAMVQANAFYSPEAKGILFGYFAASKTNPGRNLPGQRVFSCLSHDIIAHEVTHAIIDGIRTYFTEPTNPDVLAFHEAFADLAALFSHFSHKEALVDVIHRTSGQFYHSVLKPESAPNGDPVIVAQMPTRNSFIELAQQFGEASGMNRGLRSGLGSPPNTNDINTRIDDVHFRGAILVSAVFDAYFTIYVRRTAALFRVYKAGGGNVGDELPAALDELLAEQAASTASEFFQLCVRALDYCPPVDMTFGDYLRALITVHIDLTDEEGRNVREALMQAFRVRGIYAESATFFSQGALCWPRVPRWTDPPAPDALPPVEAWLPDPQTGERPRDPKTKEKIMTKLIFGTSNGMSREEKDVNGAIFRKYAEENAARLGFDADQKLPPESRPYAPSFHSMFRMARDGSLRTEMVVELVQTKKVPFDPNMPGAGSFPMRAGVTLIIRAPELGNFGRFGPAEVRYAISKGIIGTEGKLREERQREHHFATGLANGDTDDPNHFQVNFGLLHEGL